MRKTSCYWDPPYVKVCRVYAVLQPVLKRAECLRRGNCWLGLFQGGSDSREVSRMVSARRTPSGSFSNINNPSLFSNRRRNTTNSENATARSVAETLRRQKESSLKVGVEEHTVALVEVDAEGRPTGWQPNSVAVAIACAPAAEAEASQAEVHTGEASWVTATHRVVPITHLSYPLLASPVTALMATYEICSQGDRVEGKRISRLVASKRTPTGGFYNMP